MIRFTDPKGGAAYISPPFDAVSVNYGGGKGVNTHIFKGGQGEFVLSVQESVEEVMRKYKAAGYGVDE